MTRRDFLPTAAAPFVASAATRRPNVILIISDDQGFGDLSIHGNPHLATPHLDSIGRDGVRFTQFHSSPVCSPTRASLMTGRYNYRTGVVDTYLGRSMMAADEITLADVLRNAGYRTGIFGKWHLGDHYPMRAMDQGFDECVTHFGGGIGQPSDPPGGESYFDPLLQHNGAPRRYRGYCTDVFFSKAMHFIETNRVRPFFAYVATNAPHAPLEVAEDLVEPFRKKRIADREARVYGMVANLDANVGRLLAHLKRLNLDQNTILIFMTDNGPQWQRYNAGMRGLKGTVYEGGIRVPFFLRWPAQVKAGSEIDRLAAHIDVLPTIAEACGASLPRDRTIDGCSLMPLIRGSAEWSDRTLFFQWHRGDEPRHWEGACARTQQWKLVAGKALFDLSKDPEESTDIAAANGDVVRRLSAEYDTWFRDVSETRGFAPIRIPIGTPHENPVTLSQQDWRGPQAVWGPEALGHWEIDVAAAGKYEVSFLIRPVAQRDASLHFSSAGIEHAIPLEAGLTEIRLGSIELPKGPARLEASIRQGEKSWGVRFSTIRLLSPL